MQKILFFFKWRGRAKIFLVLVIKIISRLKNLFFLRSIETLERMLALVEPKFVEMNRYFLGIEKKDKCFVYLRRIFF